MANSGAILDLTESYYDAVRPGILLYGHYPSTETSCSISLKQVMTLKTFVAHVRKMPAGFPISYGRRWITPRPTQIAVLPIGYADGIRRSLTNTGEVLIQGKRYPMVGTVTMDQTMVDVGEDRVNPGDEVIIWGHTDSGTIQVAEVAEKIGTIPYELTCGISKRVKRIYLGNGVE
jgi:alanine racemase